MNIYMSRKKRKSIKKLKKKTKIGIIIAEVIVALVLLTAAVLMIIPNAKKKVIKAFVSCAPGRAFVSCIARATMWTISLIKIMTGKG